MNPITVIILNKNNNIQAALKSASLLDPQQILIGSPTEIAGEVVNVAGLNHSADLNVLIDKAQCPWIFYLKDSEVLMEVNNLELNPKNIYGCLVLQDDVIIKETRLWNKCLKLKFKNPIFERVDADPNEVLDVLIYQNKEIYKIEEWKVHNKLSVDFYYYKAFVDLANKNFAEFKSSITHYLFNVKSKDISYVMGRYYLAFVQALVDYNAQEAIKNVILCLIENPLMAEFWCLLGDIFVLSEQFDKASEFYRNAIILGNRRLKLDLWPMQISKYNDYPKEMIAKCNHIM